MRPIPFFSTARIDSGIQRAALALGEVRDKGENTMTRILRFTIATAAATLVAAPSPVWALKNTAVATHQGPMTSGILMSTLILKGKPKRYLIANATAQVEDADFCDLSIQLVANGVNMETQNEGINGGTSCQCIGPCLNCTTTTVAVLDLDAAEAANPGLFKKNSINVSLQLGAIGGCPGGSATLVVQMVKK